MTIKLERLALGFLDVLVGVRDLPARDDDAFKRVAPYIGLQRPCFPLIDLEGEHVTLVQHLSYRAGQLPRRRMDARTVRPGLDEFRVRRLDFNDGQVAERTGRDDKVGDLV